MNDGIKYHLIYLYTLRLRDGCLNEISDANTHLIFRYDPTRLLITMGAGINKQDKVNGNTPLHLACQTGNTCVVKMLFDKKADLNILNAKV